MRIIRFGVPVALAGVFAVVLFSGLAMRRSATSHKAAIRPYSLTVAAFQVSNNDKPVLQYVATKFVRSSNYWKEIRTDAQTQQVRVQQSMESGVYDLKTDKREFLGSSTTEEVPFTAESLPGHPQFARTEHLLGLTAYVLRHDIDDHNWGEFYYAPETGQVPLKIVLSHGGGSSTTTVEPMSLTFGDIPDSVFNSPATPVSYDRVQKLINDAEQDGNHEYADALRRGMIDSQNLRRQNRQ